MGDITVVRIGKVNYLAGYEQNRFEIGRTAVYETARVEQLSDGSILYFPLGAATRTTDGGCTIPESLIPKIKWRDEK